MECLCTSERRRGCKTPTSIWRLRYARRMASIAIYMLQEALAAGTMSRADVARYIRTLRRELRELEFLLLRRPPARLPEQRR